MNVLISGASIAGPALAYWLARPGHTVTVVERAPALRRGGYAVDVRGPALQVIERMGLRDAIRPLETDTLYNEVVDARGRRFGRTGRGFGVIDPGDIEILRGDLAVLLHEATRESVEYRFGDSILALDDTGSGVDVAFASGTCATYDLVVGADGVHSRTRQLAIAGDTIKTLGGAMAIFTAPNTLGLVRGQLLFTSIGKIASVKSCNHDRELKVCMFFPVAPDAFDPRDVAGQRALVDAAFRNQGWEFPRLLDAMHAADDFYADITCQVRTDTLARGRVALVGDAGYCPSPLSGQGTSLALIGAYLLAAELAAAPLTDALARYQARMLPFVRANQDVALGMAKTFAPTSSFQVRMRNVVMQLLPYMPWAPWIMKLAMRGVRKAANAIELPAAASAPERKQCAAPAAQTMRSSSSRSWF
jgi:2-polyprenyl-6-methoxyphenol hydroxylase-like FAD-dependent oxidoreductase